MPPSGVRGGMSVRVFVGSSTGYAGGDTTKTDARRRALLYHRASSPFPNANAFG